MDNPNNSNDFDGVQVFSATMAKTRDALSDRITSWLRNHPEYIPVDTVVTQSSDDGFHCLTLSIFYKEDAPTE